MMETERKKRIQASLWAYAYEVMDDPLVSDYKFDQTCREINPNIKTGRLDDFFATEFSPYTGSWIHKHPEWLGIANIYYRLTGKTPRPVTKSEGNLPVTQNVSNNGFRTQTEMKWYLASLGFRVLGHFGEHAGRPCYTEFDKECGYITCQITGEQITVFYKDLFGTNCTSA